MNCTLIANNDKYSHAHTQPHSRNTSIYPIRAESFCCRLAARCYRVLLLLWLRHAQRSYYPLSLPLLPFSPRAAPQFPPMAHFLHCVCAAYSRWPREKLSVGANMARKAFVVQMNIDVTRRKYEISQASTLYTELAHTLLVGRDHNTCRRATLSVQLLLVVGGEGGVSPPRYWLYTHIPKSVHFIYGITLISTRHLRRAPAAPKHIHVMAKEVICARPNFTWLSILFSFFILPTGCWFHSLCD